MIPWSDWSVYILEFAEAFLSESSIRYRVETPETFPGDFRVLSEIRRHLLLVVKESLSNAVKHSGASEVHLSFQLSGSAFTIEIQDNGRGFSPEAVSSFGNGLKNMEQRMIQIGGVLTTASGPGKGTGIPAGNTPYNDDDHDQSDEYYCCHCRG